MTQADGADLRGYYQKIQQNGDLPTVDVAKRWNEAALRTLGLNLDRKTKKKLGNALPEELAFLLGRTFRLVHFRNSNKSDEEFLKEVALRSGSSDPDVARIPTKAVFHEVKAVAGQDVTDNVTGALAPEISELWQQA